MRDISVLSIEKIKAAVAIKPKAAFKVLQQLYQHIHMCQNLLPSLSSLLPSLLFFRLPFMPVLPSPFSCYIYDIYAHGVITQS